MELIIEQLSRNNKVTRYSKVSGDKISIGRAYNNDIVLQEEHVNPYHAEIDIYHQDGVIVLTDLNSTNGIKAENNGRINRTTRVTSGDVFTLGKAQIRILRADHQVAPAKELSVLDDITGQLNQWYFALLALVLFWSTLMANSFFTRYDTIIWSKEAAKSSLFALILVIVPIGVAISARFFKKEVRFFASLVFSFSVFILFQFSAVVTEWLSFNWPNSGFTSVVMGAVELLLLVSLFWGLFYLASNMSMKKITLVSVAFVASISGLLFYSKQQHDIELYPQNTVVVLPNRLLLVEAEPISQQQKLHKTLFEQASQEAKNLNKEASD